MKVRKTSKSMNGTSYHQIDIKTSLSRLKDKIGEPDFEQNDGSDKVNIEYELMLDDGTLFTIYDWKMYRPIGEDEILRFHIGAHSAKDAFKAKNTLHGMGLFTG